jgi:hypothetical protein
MKDKVFVDSDSIVNWIPENVTGDVEGTSVAVNVLSELIEEHAPSSILVDLTKAQRPNTLQRQVIINALQSNKHNIHKVALFGESPLMKAVAYFIINASNYGTIRFFSSRNKATIWLKERVDTANP